MRKKLFFLLFFIASLSFLRAQDTVMLQSVEVKASRVIPDFVKPLLARKFDSLVLSATNTSNLSDLLIQHSPVFIKTFGPGGLSTASFRGTTASHTLVLWNGFKLNTPSLGQVDFSTIPVFMADDIGLKWGSGTSNHSGGLGGTVDIDNSLKFGKGLLLDLKQTYGSFNTLGSFLTIGYSGKKMAVRLRAYRNSSDNDFEYENFAVIPSQHMKQKNADFVDYGIMPELNFLVKNSILSISSWNQLNNRNLPPIMSNVNVNTKEWTKDGFSRNFISLKSFWESGTLHLKSAAFFERQQYFLLTRNSQDDTVTYYNSQNKAVVLHQIAELEQNLWRTWRLNAKLQWDNEQVKSNNYQGLKRRSMLSLYAAVGGRPFSGADLRLTLRYDAVDWKSMGVFPTATLSYELPFVKGINLTIGYSHNYRSPTLNDLYWFPGGNQDLLAENGRTGDLALKYTLKNDRLSLDVRTGAYLSRVKNWIQWEPTSYRFWVPENVALVFARGIENHVEASWQGNDWKCSISGNYVFTVTSDESPMAELQGTKGKQLIYIPKHHGNAFFFAQWRTWDAGYTLEATGARNTSFSTTHFTRALKPYVIHHLSVGKRFSRLHVELRCGNLADKAYQNVIWRPMPGRSFEIKLHYRY